MAVYHLNIWHLKGHPRRFYINGVLSSSVKTANGDFFRSYKTIGFDLWNKAGRGKAIWGQVFIKLLRFACIFLKHAFKDVLYVHQV